MSLEIIFQISIYALAAFSSVILGIADGETLPAGLTLPLAVFAYFFTERWKLVRLTTGWANLFGVGAFVIATIEFFSEDVEARLLSGAHLLVYLSWIVLFQEKNPRQYWWMCALGVLQVAVGSVLSEAPSFGAMLLFYLMLSMWTLSVYSLYRAHRRFADAEHVAVSAVDAGAAPSPAEYRMVPAERRPVLALAGGGSMTRGSIQHDPEERWINGRFVGGVLTMSILAMLIGSVFFLFIPRLWVGRLPVFRDQMLPGTRPLTGFTEEVQLGDMGQILESNERVLEIRLFDETTDEPIDVEHFAAQLGYDEPLFRGTVLDRYEDGRWFSTFARGPFWAMPIEPREGATIRQEIELQPIGTDIVFAMHPLRACRLRDGDDGFGFNPETSVIVRSDSISSRKPITYVAWSERPQTEAIRRGSAVTSSRSRMMNRLRRHYLRFPRSELPRLQALTDRLVGSTSPGGGELSEFEKAKKLEAHLRDSGEYSYTLDASIQDVTIDPVEDFLFNRKQGHCEYFASTLTLMLRAAGIPSRMVSGFKGGDKNRFNGKFIVQQRHAHAWVEAYVDGAWIALDPTPALARSESVKSFGSGFPTWASLKEAVANFWTQNVVQLSLTQQRQGLYNPLQNAATRWWNPLGARGADLIAAIKRALTSPELWFSWKSWVAVFLLLWTAFLGYRFLARLLSFFWQWHTGWRNRRRLRRTRIEFYERFQKLLKAQGLTRRATQTQREFAEDVQQRLAVRLVAAGLHDFPDDLTGVFYRVRFGAKPLRDEELRSIEGQLQKLEECLAARAVQPAGL